MRKMSWTACVAFGALCGLIVTSTADAQPAFRGGLDAYLSAAPMRGPMARAPLQGLAVRGVDAQRGVPTLVVGRGETPDASARSARQKAWWHLTRLAAAFGVGATDLQSVALTRIEPTAGGGTLAVFTQRIDGVPVFQTRLTLLLDASGAIVAAGGRLLPAARAGSFRWDARRATALALADHFASPPPALRRTQARADGWDRFALRPPSSGLAMDRDARARPVWFPLPTQLAPAFQVELWVPDPRGAILVDYVVDARDGSLLMRRELTDWDAYSYRVFADEAAPHRPVDSPFGDTTPDPLGRPVDGMLPPFAAQGMITLEAFNTNPMGGVDPWLAPGAVWTRGNNVDAYADLVAPDGFDDGDVRAITTAAGVFDHPFDGARPPNAGVGQQQAAVTHLFFVNNWLHDFYYDAGFDEAAGNAQIANFGRGGEEDDVLRAEALDHSGRNNANMSTPADGESPRMQMYLWDGLDDAAVASGGATFDVGVARFGPTSFDVTAPTAVVDDGVGTGSDGCEPIGADLSGQIAVVDRGGCSFILKIQNAEAAGALGVIVINDRGTGTTNMSGTGTTGIGALMVSQADGAGLRGGAEATLRRQLGPDAASSLDSQVVTHEWGHYLHRRLVDFGTVQGRSQSEGWGDFLSIMMLLRPGDDLRGAYPTSSYSNHGDEPLYYGTRRVPYSVDRAFDALSFRHISDGEALPDTHPVGPGPRDNSEVHNAGEIWATMMHDALVAMLERSATAGAPYDFDGGLRRMAGYIVVGMQLAPRNPTFTEQRDAMVAAALAVDPEDARLIAEAFAGRGAGTCAVSPARDSTDLIGVVEDLDLAPLPVITSLTLDTEGPGLACDADGLVDRGEDGWARVEIRNEGVVPMRGASLVLWADDFAFGLPAGDEHPIAELAPGDSVTVEVPVRVEDTPPPANPVLVRATVMADALCGDVARELRVALDQDLAPSASEDFELPPPWFAETSLDGVSAGVWSVGPSRLGGSSHALRGVGAGSITDTAVELPEVVASASDPLVLSFVHRYELEAEPGTFWDGGVIELSTDGGASWEDVSTYVTTGYDGTLTDRADNPLSFREAYSGQNPSHPDADAVRLDFDTALAGEAVRFRFRIGTDQASGTTGWEIDDLRVEGGAPLPFVGYVDDAADCADAPDADAGPDQEVASGALVTLDGSGSSDPNGDPLGFAWRGLEMDLALDDATLAGPSFVAPTVDAPLDLTLRLRVSDGAASDTDDVVIRVLPPPAPMDEDAGRPPVRADGGVASADGSAPGGDGGPGEPEGGGCGCRSAGGPTPSAAWLALAPLALLSRARRRRSRRPPARPRTRDPRAG